MAEAMDLDRARDRLTRAEAKRAECWWSAEAERELLLARQGLTRVQQRLEREAGQAALFAEETR